MPLELQPNKLYFMRNWTEARSSKERNINNLLQYSKQQEINVPFTHLDVAEMEGLRMGAQLPSLLFSADGCFMANTGWLGELLQRPGLGLCLWLWLGTRSRSFSGENELAKCINRLWSDDLRPLAILVYFAYLGEWKFRFGFPLSANFTELWLQLVKHVLVKWIK